ncbi:MAG: SsrA-binding protein SmpB [Patescibacteria group bacterium]
MATLIDNGKIHFDYEILETFEAGIELLGFEVKSVRAKKGSLEGSYIIVRGSEAFLMGMLISPYQENNTPEGYDPRRNRRLLLTAEEIRKLADIGDGKGLTIVPIKLYNKNTLIKVSVGVVRGKKKYDKRETTKKRETDRNVRREFRDR